MDELGGGDGLPVEVSRLNEQQRRSGNNKNLTVFLAVCCLSASLATFQFGYNIGALNAPSHLLKQFIKQHVFLFAEYQEKKAFFEMAQEWFRGNETLLKEALIKVEEKKAEFFDCVWKFAKYAECQKAIIDEGARKLAEVNKLLGANYTDMEVLLAEKLALLESKRPLLVEGTIKLAEGTQKVDKLTDLLWAFTNGLFVLGGMCGSFGSKLVLDFLGRRKGIMLDNAFTLVAAAFVFAAHLASSPICLMVARFFHGIQGGLCCSLVPIYLSEISPASLRGRLGAVPQLFITLGILSGQVLGFRQLLGNEEYWHVLLAFSLLPALVSLVTFAFVLPESPKALLIDKKVNEARKALQSLLNREHVEYELVDLRTELNLAMNTSSDASSMTMWGVLRKAELRWPLITALTMQITQQLCGINAIFYYSASIFADARVPSDYIQYAIVLTGLVNLLATIGCMPLLDKLGRKPLLVYPMALILVDFALLTVCLNVRGSDVASYLSIACIIIFIVCYAVGLGPIPFIYTAECFKQSERGPAVALCIFANWSSGLMLALAFPPLHALLHQFVFVVFMGIVAIGLVILTFKMPETKGKTCEEIRRAFTHRK